MTAQDDKVLPQGIHISESPIFLDSEVMTNLSYFFKIRSNIGQGNKLGYSV